MRGSREASPEEIQRARISPADAKRIFARTSGVCYLCRGKIDWEEGSRKGIWEVEHVIAFAEDPSFDLYGNFLPAHPSCNKKKSDKDIREFVFANPQFTILTAAFRSTLHEDVLQRLRDAKKQKKQLFLLNELDEHFSFPAFENELSLPSSSTKDLQIWAPVVGGGSFGEVRRGYFQSDNREVAVKTLLRGNAVDIDREISHLGVMHPRIVPFFGHFRDSSNRVNVIMDWCPYNLQQAAQDVFFCPGTPWQWACNIVEGVAYLHSLNMSHRDLKPENILIARSGCALLADLGKARYIATDDPVTASGFNGFYLNAKNPVEGDVIAVKAILRFIGSLIASASHLHVLQSCQDLNLGEILKVLDTVKASDIREALFPAQLNAICQYLRDTVGKLKTESNGEYVDLMCNRLDHLRLGLNFEGVVALRGKTGHGKSSLIDRIAGGALRLPTSAGDASTTSVPTYVWRDGAIPMTTRIRFLSYEEWVNNVVFPYCQYLSMLANAQADRGEVFYEMSGLRTRLICAYGAAAVNELQQQDSLEACFARAQSMSFLDHCKGLLGTARSISPTDDIDALDIYVRLKVKGSVATLVRHVEISGPLASVPAGVILLDLPGSADEVIANVVRADNVRSQVTWLVTKGDTQDTNERDNLADMLESLKREPDSVVILTHVDSCFDNDARNPTLKRLEEWDPRGVIRQKLGVYKKSYDAVDAKETLWRLALCATEAKQILEVTGCEYCPDLDECLGALNSQQLSDICSRFHVSRLTVLAVNGKTGQRIEKLTDLLQLVGTKCGEGILAKEKELRELLNSTPRRVLHEELPLLKDHLLIDACPMQVIASASSENCAKLVVEKWNDWPGQTIRALYLKNRIGRVHVSSKGDRLHLPSYVASVAAPLFPILSLEAHINARLEHNPLGQKFKAEWVAFSDTMRSVLVSKLPLLINKILTDTAEDYLVPWMQKNPKYFKHLRNEDWRNVLKEVFDHLFRCGPRLVEVVIEQWSAATTLLLASLKFDPLKHENDALNLSTILRRTSDLLDQRVTLNGPPMFQSEDVLKVVQQDSFKIRCPLSHELLQDPIEFSNTLYSRASFLKWFQSVAFPIAKDPLGHSIAPDELRFLEKNGFHISRQALENLEIRKERVLL